MAYFPFTSDARRLLPAPDARTADAAHGRWRQVRSHIDHHLTVSQRDVQELYYVRGMGQAVVASLVGISQLSVCEHLFGETRNGTQVSGVIRTSRKLCEGQGVRATRIVSWARCPGPGRGAIVR